MVCGLIFHFFPSSTYSPPAFQSDWEWNERHKKTFIGSWCYWQFFHDGQVSSVKVDKHLLFLSWDRPPLVVSFLPFSPCGGGALSGSPSGNPWPFGFFSVLYLTPPLSARLAALHWTVLSRPLGPLCPPEALGLWHSRSPVHSQGSQLLLWHFFSGFCALGYLRAPVKLCHRALLWCHGNTGDQGTPLPPTCSSTP